MIGILKFSLVSGRFRFQLLVAALKTGYKTSHFLVNWTYAEKSK